jgi:hypothetical protein
VTKAKARIMSKFQEADDRVRRADVATNSPTTSGADVATNSRRSQEERKTAGPTPPAPSFVLSEWLLLLGMTGGLLLVSGSHTLWQKRNDQEFARQLRAKMPGLFALLQRLGWPHVAVD